MQGQYYYVLWLEFIANTWLTWLWCSLGFYLVTEKLFLLSPSCFRFISYNVIGHVFGRLCSSLALWCAIKYEKALQHKTPPQTVTKLYTHFGHLMPLFTRVFAWYRARYCSCVIKSTILSFEPSSIISLVWITGTMAFLLNCNCNQFIAQVTFLLSRLWKIITNRPITHITSHHPSVRVFIKK